MRATGHTQLDAYSRKRIDRLSGREVQRFLLHLHDDKGLAWSTCNTMAAGLRFFYHVTLGKPDVEIPSS